MSIVSSGSVSTGNDGNGRLTGGVRGMGRGLALAALAPVELVLFTVMVVAISLLSVGLGLFLVPAVAIAVRGTANLTRGLAHRWSGVGIPEPYLPRPRTEPGLKGQVQRTQWVLTDQATWRDLAWMLVNPVVGLVMLLLPLALTAYGVFGLLMPFLWESISDAGGNNWYGMIKVSGEGTALAAAALGVPVLLLGLFIAPALLKLHASFAHTLLTPTEVSQQVRHLTESRSDAVNTSAAELRRIERDLHDGAQARLVAMGMNLGVAERLLEKDPEAVRAILVDTRQASANALTELRDLVRGIHPPVLADRGLADAVRALGMDSPLDVEVNAELPGRPEAPVESAMYFAVSEALTNAAKHGSAQRVTVELWHEDGRLRTQVTDDGDGGADPSRGTGLRGMERRLATFDGVLAVTSPVGGPTTLTMELPCVLSSPKTSSC
ncbi:sensor histidine kinase [Streptomyces sp. H27-D2]|uniref:sensor histidine kinase n=1 Tax=Streptomyces sp. H27-D2 TaxID=3046304 RepID=UPI002DBE79E4|nr:sensor domain-containing protein [Streptomyces sp. H27-D2]MEC4017539.1 sensor domain-containing protein [Streptomyces sp. H27-D2]